MQTEQQKYKTFSKASLSTTSLFALVPVRQVRFPRRRRP